MDNDARSRFSGMNDSAKNVVPGFHLKTFRLFLTVEQINSYSSFELNFCIFYFSGNDNDYTTDFRNHVIIAKLNLIGLPNRLNQHCKRESDIFLAHDFKVAQ